MIRHVLVTITLLGGLLMTGTGPSQMVEPAAAARVARPSLSVADTVRTSVPAGRVLVYTLPDEVDGEAVGSYRLLRGPALSGVAGRSLTWITRRTAPGAYNVLLEARRPNASSDTLVVRIDVQP